MLAAGGQRIHLLVSIHANAEAEELLASDEFRTRIAEQAYAGIADYATRMLTGGTEGTADGASRRPR